jgi:hypothetical protein
MSKFGYIFLVLFAFFFSTSLYCSAEREKIGLSVDQSIFSFNLYPGQQQEFVLRVKNITDRKQQFDVEVRDFSVDNNNKTNFLPERNELFGMKDWIKPEGENVWMIEAGEERLVKFILSVPENANVGSHYSAVIFSVLPEIDFENFQKPIVRGEVGTYIFLNVGGQISGDGLIENFTSPLVIDKEADFSVTFENRGNVHYVPYGEIKIKNIISQKDFNNKLEKHFVFPGKKYTFKYNWKPPSTFGIYTAEAFFVDQTGRNLSEKKMLFGKAFLMLIGALVFMIVIISIIIKRRSKNKFVRSIAPNNTDGQNENLHKL